MTTPCSLLTKEAAHTVLDAMTLEQALDFRMSGGKRLRDMSPDDWREWLRRIGRSYGLTRSVLARAGLSWSG